jgi:hypothetical protein
MQKCPRAFVLRYGIAAYATKHPTGQMLREYFSIQTPWILMQMSIRETIRDYVEDYQIGMKWSKNLIRLKFNQFFRHRVKERNSIISELSAWKEQKSMFHRVKPEQHLEEIGAKRCIKLIQHKSFTHLLNTMTFESISPLKSKIVDGIKVYNSPDFCAEKGETINLNPNQPFWLFFNRSNQSKRGINLIRNGEKDHCAVFLEKWEMVYP